MNNLVDIYIASVDYYEILFNLSIIICSYFASDKHEILCIHLRMSSFITEQIFKTFFCSYEPLYQISNTDVNDLVT